MKKEISKKYSKLPIPETHTLGQLFEKVDQRGRSQENKPAVVHWTIQGILSMQENNMRIAPPRLETEQYWKNIWEMASNAQWLAELWADLPEQDQVTRYMSGAQKGSGRGGENPHLPVNRAIAWDQSDQPVHRLG